MVGLGECTSPFHLNSMVSPDVILDNNSENKPSTSTLPESNPVSNNLSSNSPPQIPKPSECVSKNKRNILSHARKHARAHPESIETLIKAINEISSFEWKVRRTAQRQQQQFQQQNESTYKQLSEQELQFQILEKMEEYKQEERNFFKSNESIESTTSSINITNHTQVIPFTIDMFQSEISVPPGVLQIIAMFIQVLAKRFPSWRCDYPVFTNNSANTCSKSCNYKPQNMASGDYLTSWNNKSFNNSVTDDGSEKKKTTNSVPSFTNLMQLQRYYCHLRNIELMAIGHKELTRVYTEIAEAIVPSIYGDKLISIPPTFGAISLVIDAKIVDSQKTFADTRCLNFTYSDCYVLDMIMKRLDFVVTEKSCLGYSSTDGNVSLEKAKVQDSIFKYLPPYPFENKCCRFLVTDSGTLSDIKSTGDDSSNEFALYRYSVCNKCLIACLCNCPITQQVGVDSDVEWIPSHFSNTLDPSHQAQSDISEFSDSILVSRPLSYGSYPSDYKATDEVSDHSSLYSAFEDSANNYKSSMLLSNDSSVLSGSQSFNSNTLVSIDCKFLKQEGSFKISEGNSSINPQMPFQIQSHFLSSINTTNQTELLQIITGPCARILKLICGNLNCQIPNLDFDIFWWRSMEAYFGRLLIKSNESIKPNGALGRFLESIVDVDKLVDGFLQAIESATNNFKRVDDCIRVMIPNCEHIYRVFEKEKLGSWGFFISSVEFLLNLNVLTQSFAFDERTLSFFPSDDNTRLPRGAGNVKADKADATSSVNYYPIYIYGIPACLARIFTDMNPNYSLTLDVESGADRADFGDLRDVYQSIALEIEELLINLTDSDSLETIAEVGNKIQSKNGIKKNYCNVSVTSSSYILTLPLHFCGICYRMKRDCVASKNCFTCSASREIIETALLACNSTRHLLEIKHGEIVVTFSISLLGKNECIRLVRDLEQEFIDESIFQTCKSVSSNKIAIISPVYKKVTSFTVQSCGSMANAMQESRKYCKELHQISYSSGDPFVFNDLVKPVCIAPGTLAFTDWGELKLLLNDIFRTFSDGLRGKAKLEYRIMLSDDQFALVVGDRSLYLDMQNVTNLVSLGESVVETLKLLGRHHCSSTFVDNFDESSPRLI